MSKPCHLTKRLVALEDQVVAPSLEAEVMAIGPTQAYADILEKAEDIGADRLAAMDARHIFMSVLGQNSPSGSEDLDGCRADNGALQFGIEMNPKRFAGFGLLPMALPEQAATELNRTVTYLKLKGAMMWNYLKDGKYNVARFDPVFAMAQELDVPL